MTVNEQGRFDDDSKEEILQFLINRAKVTLGSDLDPDEVSVLRSFYDPVAGYLAEQQDDISDVLDASQIAHADGAALGLLTALVGVTRKEATAATTPLRFSRDSPTGSNYSVPEGTAAQTDENEPIEFETTEATAIRFLEGFEDGDITEYSGDTGDWSTQQTTTFEGNYALQGPSVSGSTIYDTSNEVEYGARFHFRAQLNNNAVGSLLIGVQDADNNYRIRLNDNKERVAIQSVDGGTVTTLNSTSPQLPNGEWIHVWCDWNRDYTFEIYVEDSAGNELASFTATDSNALYEVGGIGFNSGNNNNEKYFDNITMSAASAPAKATTAGNQTNVAKDTLVVMPNKPAGVEDVSNRYAANGGRDREDDLSLRERAKDELSDGMRGTQRALINRLDKVEGTRSVTVIVNDTSSQDADGRPSHSFEAVVETGTTNYEDVAQTILDTKAGGDIDVGGYAGTSVTQTADLPNGQTKDITFSVPTEITIYVDISLTKTDTYPGDEAVRDSIVRYVGGELTSGQTEDGELNAGDDVIYNTVLEAVMNVDGVYDVTNLDIGTSDDPTGTSNISIADTEVATTDGTDVGIIGVTSSDA